MVYVPGFKHDVFISYAHVDNLPLTGNDEAWVDDFHKKLEIRLARILGRSDIFSVWRDLKLRGNDEWEDTIDAACRNSAAGIFILSPGFVASRWCRGELDAFASSEDIREHARPPGRSRIFKVFLSPVSDQDVPGRLRTVNGYPFHAVDSMTGREELFRRTRESDSDQRYWTSLGDLARELADMLKQMRLLAEGAAAPPRATGPVVFLAEVTDDLVEAREDLRRTLLQGGAQVLPENPLPFGAEELRLRLREDLAQAKLAVHLVGSFYGRRPAGEERSFTHVQYAQAAEAGVQRLLWVPRDIDPEKVRDAAQRKLLAALESEPDSAHSAELLRVRLEELKELLLSRLFPPAEKPLPETPGALVYISCQPEDDAAAHDLKSALRSARHDVVLPARHGEPTALERHYLTNLRYCDALLVLYAGASVLWVREELIRARRITAADRRGSGFLMAVYDGPPPTKEDIGLDFQNLLVLRCRDGADRDRLRPFLDRLQSAQV
jgi:hypothetical protein